MRVLVIGAAGYLGGRIAAHLTKNHEVIQTSRRAVPGAIIGNVLEPKMQDEIARLTYDACVYTVSLNHNKALQDWELAFDVGVKSTFRFLDLAQKAGVEKFIYFSTQQVYGPFNPKFTFREDEAAIPTTPHGLTHLLSEEIVSFYATQKKIKPLSFRISNAIGAPVLGSAHIDSLVAPDMCRMAMREGVIRMKSDGTPQRNFILVSDICEAVEKSLSLPNEKINHTVYNLGSPTTISLAELAWKIKVQAEQKTGKKIEIFFDGNEPLKNIDRFLKEKKFTYPLERLREMGIATNPNFDAGIAELLEFYSR